MRLAKPRIRPDVLSNIHRLTASKHAYSAPDAAAMEEVVWTPRSPAVQVEARARPAQNLRWSRESVVSGANNLDVAAALAARRAQEDKLARQQAHQRDINQRELELRRRDNEKALELAAVQTA